MKTLTVCVSLIAILVISTEVHADIRDGLAAYYALNGNVLDLSGNNNYGVMEELSPAKGYDGKEGCAYYFNGANSYVIIPAAPSLDIRGSVSLCAWVKNDGDDDGIIIWRGDVQSGADPYLLHLEAGKMEFRQDRGDGVNGGVGHYNVSKDKVDNEWHFWVAVFNEAESKSYLYKDGVLDNVVDVNEPLFYETSQMWNTIGAVDTGNWQHFRGIIDEVRIYNRALTSEEIAIIQNTKNP
jgi:hypothetical protein